MKSQALIVAAGRGTRLGISQPKALLSLAGRPMLVHTLEPFIEAATDGPIVVAVPPDALDLFRETLDEAYPSQEFRIIPGGDERQDSVRGGIEALDEDTELVIVHDAARPFIETECIQRAVAAAVEYGAATVAVPSVDTILEADAGGFISGVPERATMWACQTPQVFRVGTLREGHQRALDEGASVTDDSRLLHDNGHPVKIVEGSPSNRKITTPDDIAWAETFIEQRQNKCVSD